MKRRFKQAVSTVLVTLMALQPLGSFSAVAATQYDPDYVDEIIDEDEEWEESTFFSARTATDANASVTSVAVTSNAPSEGVSVGKEVTITAKVTPASGSNWSTATNSDARKISINSNGLFEKEPTGSVNDTTITFTGKVSGEPGEYDVVVTVNGVSGSTTVVVKEEADEPTPDDEIKGSFDKEISRILKGGADTATLILEGNGDISKVTYMAGKEEVATVSGDHTDTVTIQAVGVGTTRIYAMNGDTTVAVLDVEVNEVTLAFEKEALSVEKGKEAATTLSASWALSDKEGWPTSGDVLSQVDFILDSDLIDYDYDNGNGTLTIIADEAVGTTTITATYEDAKAVLNVVVRDPEDETKVEEGAPEVELNTSAEDIVDKIALPDDLDEEEAVGLAKEVLNSITANEEIKEGVDIQLDPNKTLTDLNPNIPENVNGEVYPIHTVESVEMDFVKNADGEYVALVKKVSYDISLYWRATDYDSDEAYKLNVTTGRYTIRIPVPTSIGDNRYANVKHDGKSAGQKQINKENAESFFITITVTHFSIFELEFTNQRISTGGSSGGGGGGGSRTYSGGVANLVGNWILDANQRWWFSLTGGGYPANNWGRINNKWYYFGADGYMMTGWLNLAGKWYFLQPAGDMIENNWYLYNNQWYYLGSDGAMLTNQWVSHNNQWYYMNADGTMAVNTTTPDGYTVDANGVWVQ